MVQTGSRLILRITFMSRIPVTTSFVRCLVLVPSRRWLGQDLRHGLMLSVFRRLSISRARPQLIMRETLSSATAETIVFDAFIKPGLFQRLPAAVLFHRLMAMAPQHHSRRLTVLQVQPRGSLSSAKRTGISFVPSRAHHAQQVSTVAAAHLSSAPPANFVPGHQ